MDVFLDRKLGFYNSGLTADLCCVTGVHEYVLPCIINLAKMFISSIEIVQKSVISGLSQLQDYRSSLL